MGLTRKLPPDKLTQSLRAMKDVCGEKVDSGKGTRLPR